MCPMKLGDEVRTDWATILLSRNSTCSDTNSGSSGIWVSRKSCSRLAGATSPATMREPRKPSRLSEISRSSRLSVDWSLSGRVKILCIVSRVASAFFVAPWVALWAAAGTSDNLAGEELSGTQGLPGRVEDLIERAGVEVGRVCAQALAEHRQVGDLEVGQGAGGVDEAERLEEAALLEVAELAGARRRRRSARGTAGSGPAPSWPSPPRPGAPAGGGPPPARPRPAGDRRRAGGRRPRPAAGGRRTARGGGGRRSADGTSRRWCRPPRRRRWAALAEPQGALFDLRAARAALGAAAGGCLQPVRHMGELLTGIFAHGPRLCQGAVIK